ncbi:MAG: site-specific integrase [Lachnospiraceae bacterium]|nr:site-specific integrase [Lachnospiraceae bacterium]
MNIKEGSTRERGNGIELRVRINGKQHSFYGKNEAEARRKLREYRKIMKDNAESIEYSKEYLVNYIENWLQIYKFGKIKDSSYDILERVFNNQIKPSELAKKKLKDITIDDMQFFVNDISSKYSESILKKIIEIMNPAIKRAVIENKMKFNPLDFVAMPKRNVIIGMDVTDDNKEQLYTEQEIEKITKSCMCFYGTSTRNTNRYRYAPAYVLLLNTGMRVGELAALTWNDIDLEKKTIKITKTVSTIKNRGRFDSDSIKVNIVTTTKTQNSNRVIPMNETACLVLKELKRRQLEMGIKTNYVISTKEGELMLVRVIEQTFSRICEENGIQYRGIHALRHTFGSILVRKGVDIKIISEILGHSTVQFTYDRYIHIIKEMKAQAVNLIQISDVKQYV